MTEALIKGANQTSWERAPGIIDVRIELLSDVGGELSEECMSISE